jgi:hypothetical protein
VIISPHFSPATAGLAASQQMVREKYGPGRLLWRGPSKCGSLRKALIFGRLGGCEIRPRPSATESVQEEVPGRVPWLGLGYGAGARHGFMSAGSSVPKAFLNGVNCFWTRHTDKAPPPLLLAEAS